TPARSTSTATASRPSPPSTAAPARSSATSSHSAASACRAAPDRGIVRGIPGLTLDPEAEAFRVELREFLDSALVGGPPDLTDLAGWDESFEREVLQAAGGRGFLGVSLPVELGGGGKPPSWQAAVSYEAAYHDAPLIDTAAVLVAP